VILADDGPLMPGHANLKQDLAEKVVTDQQIWTRNHGICGHETISAAFRPLNILGMDLMNDDAEWYWLMIPMNARPYQFWDSSWLES
jgi:hypothetical protein